MEMHHLLEEVRAGTLSVEEAVQNLKKLPYENLEFTRIDHHRALRRGFAEVVYGAGKTPEQLGSILQKLSENTDQVLATRCSPEQFEVVKRAVEDAEYHLPARAITVVRGGLKGVGLVAICTGGTADIPVAEEAAITAEIFGAEVERYFDVGVAGIHRLFDILPAVQKANAVVCVAGMEGALPGVVAGLLDVPVIAVPTSVGYGANFNGIAPLLTMINSCAEGIGVVNIDNGFGGGYLAAQINKLASKGESKNEDVVF